MMIHSLADVQSKDIGDGTKIWQFCVVLKNALIGKDCNINCQVFIENDVIIGDNVTIKPGVQVWDGLRIGDNVFIGPNVTFVNDRTPRSKQCPEMFVRTVVEAGASIGANATILGGIKIGSYSMIGAGCVLTKDTAPFTLWFGNPAQHKGFVTKSGTILDLNLKDKLGKQYKIVKGEPCLDD